MRRRMATKWGMISRRTTRWRTKLRCRKGKNNGDDWNK